jgi:carboxyl-terminal processing protease
MTERRSPVARGLRMAAAGFVVLIVGIWIGGHASWLPAPLRSNVLADKQAQLVHQVLDEIQADYYKPVDRGKLVNSGLSAMISSLHDPFSHYFSPTTYKSLFGAQHLTGIGIDVEQVSRGLQVIDVFSGYPAAKAGLQSGDLILKVGSTPLAGRSSDFAAGLIQGPAGTHVTITYLGGGRQHTVTIKRERIIVPIDTSRMINYRGKKLGYVQLTTFNQSGAGDYVRADVVQLLHQGAQGIILDLRGNGGGLISEAVKTASIFIPSGTIATIAGRNTPRQVFTATGHPVSSSIPVVVLVDGQTASASEIVTAALQDDHRALVVGTHTFGKGVFQDSFGLPGGGVLEIVAGYYYTPNGRNLGGGGVKQGAGVKPNIYATDNPSSPVDHQLRVALKTLANEVQ